MLKRRPYKVVAVHREAPAVWTLTLDPPLGTRLAFAPGQFQFLRPLTGSLLAEEHPFSIASGLSSDGQISLTIKESGNFTLTIGKLAPGDLVTVHGPFGRFSHVFHAESDDLVFVAAGVGITPLMSMLRHMRDRRDGRRVLLVYANRDSSAIVFRHELESLEAGGFPLLRVVHIVSGPMDDPRMLPGRLDARVLQAICGNFSDKSFFICCPPPMMASLISGLRRRSRPAQNPCGLLWAVAFTLLEARYATLSNHGNLPAGGGGELCHRHMGPFVPRIGRRRHGRCGRCAADVGYGAAVVAVVRRLDREMLTMMRGIALFTGVNAPAAQEVKLCQRYKLMKMCN